jgi:hypothetical protein
MLYYCYACSGNFGLRLAEEVEQQVTAKRCAVSGKQQPILLTASGDEGRDGGRHAAGEMSAK